MTPRSSNVFLWPLALAALVALLWAFPRFWYNNSGEGETHWFTERTEVPGWGFRAIPVDAAAEKVLVADRTVNGEFTNKLGQVVNVFSAKRFEEKANEIGLFIHTPDRCWVEAGWKIEPSTAPTFREFTLHGARITVERRIYGYRNHSELVYFFGLMGGRALPYRLDHYFSTGLRSAEKEFAARNLVRASDSHFWSRLWDSFTSRREMLGPKQFVRISTAATSDELDAADRRLEEFLSQWLVPADYDSDKREWKLASVK